MRLGRGLSNIVKSKHSSCFDMGACFDEDMGQGGARQSFSESDISSLFESSSNIENFNSPLRENSSVSNSTIQSHDQEMQEC